MLLAQSASVHPFPTLAHYPRLVGQRSHNRYLSSAKSRAAPSEIKRGYRKMARAILMHAMNIAD